MLGKGARASGIHRQTRRISGVRTPGCKENPGVASQQIPLPAFFFVKPPRDSPMASLLPSTSGGSAVWGRPGSARSIFGSAKAMLEGKPVELKLSIQNERRKSQGWSGFFVSSNPRRSCAALTEPPPKCRSPGCATDARGRIVPSGSSDSRPNSYRPRSRIVE